MDRKLLEELRTAPADIDLNGFDGEFKGVVMTVKERDALFAYIDQLEAQIASLENSMDEMARDEHG